MSGQPESVVTGASHVDGKALVRRYLQDVFSDGNVDAIGEYLAGDAFKRSVADLVARWRTAFPDFRIDVDRAIAEEDRVVTVEILSGTHEGVYESTIGPIAATGNHVKWSRIAIRTLREGRFVDGFFEEDEVGLLRQLDALTVQDDWAAGHRPQARADVPANFHALRPADPALPDR